MSSHSNCLNASGHEGLKEVVNQAAALKGCVQKAPYVQADINLQDKAQVEAADRKRFTFVNEIVEAVEKRKVFTREKNKQDSIDQVLTNKFVGIPIFAAIMFAVFYISQSTVGTWLANWLVGWIEAFQAGLPVWWKGQIHFCRHCWWMVSSAA